MYVPVNLMDNANEQARRHELSLDDSLVVFVTQTTFLNVSGTVHIVNSDMGAESEILSM